MTLEVSGALKRSGWVLRFAGDDLALMHRSNGFPQRLLVTFDELSAFNHARQVVSGERIALDCSADHLHLSTGKTAWYQTPEIYDVVPVMQTICSDYEEVILYGHSMGGYAALLLSGLLRATNVVAFAPQFSVDPTRVPFETRFDGYVRNIAFIFDDMLSSMSEDAALNIVYDPYTIQDKKHADLFLVKANAKAIPLPFAGHFPGEFLKEAGCLSQTTVDLLLGRPNAIERRQRIRRGRRESHRYFLQRATNAAQRGDHNGAFRLASIAYVLRPDSPAAIETFHALLMYDQAFYAVSHAMVRLIQHEMPGWTHYDSTRAHIFEELRKIAEPVIKRGAPSSPSGRPVDLDD